MSEDLICIRRVLSEIYCAPEPFALTFITQDGRRVTKESVRIGGGKRLTQRQGQVVPAAPTREGRRIKENHLLLLYDNLARHPFYAKICLLTHWNGLRIKHLYGK